MTELLEHLQQNASSKLWSYRRRVPADLVEHLGKSEIKVALGTSDQLVAALAGRAITERVERMFEVVRETVYGHDGDPEMVCGPVEKACREALDVYQQAMHRLNSGIDMPD